MNKIYIFINQHDDDNLTAAAIAEDGAMLAAHISSSEAWLKYDMGITSERKHDAYKAHYPEGYELEYVPEQQVIDRTHTELEAALRLNQHDAK